MSVETYSTAPKLQDLINSIDDGCNLGYHLAEGVDSAVYQSSCGRWAIKIYKGYKIGGETVSLAKLREYQNITNKASVLMEKENWRISDCGLTIPIRAVPIEAAFYSSTWDKVMSVSQFIDGPNMSEYAFEQKGIKEQKIYDLALLKMMEYSLILNQELKVEGINIGPINTKLVRQDKGWAMAITDLCPMVTRLRKI